MLVLICMFFTVLLMFICFYLKRKYSYWDRICIKTLPGYWYFLGHFKDNFSGTVSLADLIIKWYNNTKELFIGIYATLRPMLLIHDSEVLRLVLFKDFNHFTNRGVLHANEHEPLTCNLFSHQVR